MSFYELLDQATDLLKRHGRVTYRALKLELKIDDEELEAIKDELVYALQLAVDEDGRVLVHTGVGQSTPVSKGTSPDRPATPPRTPPSHLAQRILESRAALEGERKLVTVLFADIKSSTELIRSLDPEDARGILDPAVELMIDAVHRYEGTVNQVLGDGIMALFGAPLANEDHAIRACYAALDMQASMLRYSEELQDNQGLSLKIGVGLNSGEVVVRTIGNDLHMEYSAVGQTTNLSAKMQAAAKPATILITKETAQLVEGLVEMESLDPVQVEGIVDPIEAFELLDVTSNARRLQVSIAKGLTRFVGRETEFATFQSVIQEAARGKGQLVAIVGEPGVGKSRLIYEFLNSDWCDEWTALQSSSVSYGKVRAYFPVIHLLRRYFELADDLPPENIESVVKTKLPELSADLEDSIPPLLALLDALPSDDPFHKLEPSEQHRATLEALRRLFFYESQRSPLIVIFEDLHCIDNATQIFLDSVVEMLPRSRMVLLVNYRPEYRHDWGHKSYYTQMQLGQLSSETVRDMLGVLLGNERSLTDIKQLLAERTQGNPFFLEEMTRTLAETSILAGDKGAYRLTQMPERLEIPSTVQAVLAARIDRLAPEQKELLQTAAVIGRDVPLPLLQSVSELEESNLQRELSTLTSAEFIYETRLYPERAFTFKHALTNEVAYESLLREKRRALHAKIVIVLEDFAGERVDEHVERLAPHAMLGELWEKAANYFWKAGTKATGRSALREARECLENSLNATAKLPASRENTERQIDLHLDLRNVLFLLGELSRVAEHLHHAESLAETLGDQARAAKVLNFLCSYYGIIGEPERAIESGQRALRLPIAEKDTSLRVVTNYYLGTTYNKMGDYRQAIQVLQNGIRGLKDDLTHERFGTPILPSVMCRSHLVQCLAAMGHFDDGIVHGEEAIQIAEEANHPVSLMYACCSLGVLFLTRGDLNKAIELLRRSLLICDSADLPVYVPFVSSRLGSAYAESGQLSEALPLLERGVHASGSVGRVGFLSLSKAWLSEGYLLSGRLDEAHVVARQACELSEEHKEHGHRARALKLIADISLHHEPPELDNAQEYYTQALAESQKLGMRPLQAHCHVGLGKVYAGIGCMRQAKDNFGAAKDLFQSMKMDFWLVRAESAAQSSLQGE